MFKDFTPTKTMLAWTAVGASVLTMALGFMVGGWVTGGTANKMATDAATAAHVDLAANVCAENFIASPTARIQQEELLALSSFRQRGFVEEQPWALMPGEDSVNRRVAEACARIVAAIEPESLPPVEAAAVVLEESEVDPG